MPTTDEHPFAVLPDRAFVLAADLAPGVQFLGPKGEIQTLVSTHREPHPEGVPVYNFEVNGLHTYFVASHPDGALPLLVHNACVYRQMVRGTPRYIGVTDNFRRRMMEHLRIDRLVKVIRGLPDLTRKQGRALEHLLIEKYGRRDIDPRGILENVYRGIDPRKLKDYVKELKFAKDLIKRLKL